MYQRIWKIVNLDIVDRSASVGRSTLDTLGNLGLAMQPTAGGNNGLFIGNGAGPTTIPAAGGALYVAAGRLFYRGSAGRHIDCSCIIHISYIV